MAIQPQAQFKEKMRRDSYILIARDDVQYEPGDCEACHEASDPDERTHVAAKQCGVDQQLGKIRLHQAGGGSHQPHQSYGGKLPRVWQDEAESASVLSEPCSSGFVRHHRQ